MSANPTPSKSADFVHTGPGTAAGRYLRRFWQPVYAARKLAVGQAVPIRIMGEDFTLYRGESGRAHVVAHQCAHRGTQLSTGWVEGDSIRCFFHGWRYAQSGQCLEQPGEPTPFCAKVKIAAYPTEEYLEFIFAYLGEGPPPPLPRWPELECPTPAAGTLESTVEMFPCNYFQHAENIIDEVHQQFVHFDSPVNLNKSVPRLSAQETGFGLSVSIQHTDTVLKTEFIMPNQCYLSAYSPPYESPTQTAQGSPGQIIRNTFWYVPIDDESHLHFQTILWPAGWPIIDQIRADATPIHQEVAAVLAGKKTLSQLKDHPNYVRIQDGVSLAGQGTIVDRSQERLGSSDAAIILLRKLWARELGRLLAGEPLTPFSRPDAQYLAAEEVRLREHDAG